MKRYLTLIFLLAGFTSIAQVSIGPKAGYVASSLRTETDSIADALRNGFQLGIFLRTGQGLFYFQPELMYVSKGGIIEDTYGKGKADIEINSIDVPLLLGLRFGTRNANFRLHTGPVGCFVVNKKIKTISGQGMLDEEDLADFYLGAQMGVGFDFLIFSFDVRYELGWENLYEGTTDDPDFSLENRNFNVSLALKLF